eukprot:PhF_6_TR6802/c0_g1_i1/m.9786
MIHRKPPLAFRISFEIVEHHQSPLSSPTAPKPQLLTNQKTSNKTPPTSSFLNAFGHTGSTTPPRSPQPPPGSTRRKKEPSTTIKRPRSVKDRQSKKEARTPNNNNNFNDEEDVPLYKKYVAPVVIPPIDHYPQTQVVGGSSSSIVDFSGVRTAIEERGRTTANRNSTMIGMGTSHVEPYYVSDDIEDFFTAMSHHDIGGDAGGMEGIGTIVL